MAEELNKSAKAGSEVFRHVYDDTAYYIDSIVNEYDLFPQILQMMKDGNATIELKKRFMLRAIDEAWVNAIEDTLPSLDMIIRNPSKFIEEREEVLPIELTKNISVRSLQHLSQHTNYISKIEGDKITPTKILNVYREETLQTYENKFINTLINRLYIFVNRRYQIAKKSGQDEKTTSLEFNDSFDHSSVKVNMHFKMEIAEPAEYSEDRAKRNYTYTTDLWKRVEKLHQVVNTYANSDFVQNMGQSYIRPPVMRTNAILKNKNLRQCLILWQFIESYENAGYSLVVEESLEKVDEAYIKELYSTLALQYFIFRHNIRNEFEEDKTLASQYTADALYPKVKDELEELKDTDEFDEEAEKRILMPSVARSMMLTPDDEMMAESINVAVDAAEVMHENGQEEYTVPAYVEEPTPLEKYIEKEMPELPEIEDPDESDDEEMITPGVIELTKSIRELTENLESLTDPDLNGITEKIRATLKTALSISAAEENAPAEPLTQHKKKRSKSRKKIRRPYNKTKIKGSR